MNPIDGMPGETYLWQLNMIPAGQEPVQPSKEVPPEPEEPEEKSLREVRSARSFHERKRISEIYKVKFEEVAKRFVKRDRQNILKITRAQLGERNLKGFQDEVNTYYNGSTDYVKRNISSVYIPFAAEIYVAAAEEVNADSQLTARYNRDVQIFIDKITDRHIRERSHEITKLAETAQSEQKDPEEAITARLDEWDEKYPAKFAEREAVGGETGLASQVYFSNGFRTRWVTMGDSCPYCNSLNGRVVSEGGVFLAPFEPSGAIHGPLVSSTRISHPPAHGSCDCGVMASI
jgi:hypothetical protein